MIMRCIYLRHCLRNVIFLLALGCIGPGVHAESLTLVTANYPPFSYLEDGQQKGLAIDLVKEAFIRMNQPIKIILVPFPRAVSMIKSGEADAIFPFAISEERKSYTRYPVEKLLLDPGTLFVRADSKISFDGDYSKLTQYTIGLQRGTNHGPAFMDALKTHAIKVDEAIDQEQNILKLVVGRFDIAVGPKLVVLNAAKRVGQSSAIKVLYAGISEGDAYVGFSRIKNREKLIARFEQTLKKMRQDGTYDRIVSSY